MELLSDPRYRTKRWLVMRAEQLTAEPLCRMCLDIGRETPANTADHMIPHRGNEDLFWNGELQSLCSTCHSSHKQAQEHGHLVRGCDASGMPLDGAHHWHGSNSITTDEAGAGRELAGSA